jgi:hypothetical protein
MVVTALLAAAGSLARAKGLKGLSPYFANHRDEALGFFSAEGYQTVADCIRFDKRLASKTT